jgi:hypothetical protein
MVKGQTGNSTLKENTIRGPTLPNFKTYYTGIVIKIVDTELSRIVSPELHPHKCSPLIFEKGPNQCNRNIVFSKMVLEQWTSTCKK